MKSVLKFEQINVKTEFRKTIVIINLEILRV